MNNLYRNLVSFLRKPERKIISEKSTILNCLQSIKNICEFENKPAYFGYLEMLLFLYGLKTKKYSL